MGDFEARGFGWRLLIVVQRWKPETPPPSAPATLQSHGGAFEPNASTWYDDKQVALGFGITRKSAVTPLGAAVSGVGGVPE